MQIKNVDIWSVSIWSVGIRMLYTSYQGVRVSPGVLQEILDADVDHAGDLRKVNTTRIVLIRLMNIQATGTRFWRASKTELAQFSPSDKSSKQLEAPPYRGIKQQRLPIDKATVCR